LTKADILRGKCHGIPTVNGMLPLVLDLTHLSVALAGEGEAFANRLRMLREAGAQSLTVFSPSWRGRKGLADGWSVERRWPGRDDIAGLNLLFIAGAPEAIAKACAGWARQAKTLVNTEDVRPLCDAHVPAMLRRGDLLITVSTSGRSPGLARALKEDLARRYGPEWAARLDDLATARVQWRSAGDDLSTLARRTAALIDEKRWLA
jgi:precorrin-2 dehydrogenase/sirohydrochlorin ferrochelatase